MKPGRLPHAVVRHCRLQWSKELLEAFGVPATAVHVVASNRGFGRTRGVSVLYPTVRRSRPCWQTRTLRCSVWLYRSWRGETTYGTGSSVMAPVAERSASEDRVPTTLAWIIEESPTYALEGNILSPGATLAWTADLLTEGGVADLIALAETAPDSSGVTLVPAFSGLGAPHWDRDAHALISGMSPTTTRAHVARAAVHSVSHQICDIVDVIEHCQDRSTSSGPTVEPRPPRWPFKHKPISSGEKSK